jgi:hypothetical protein
MAAKRVLARRRKVAVLTVPWLFLIAFAAIYFLVLWPQVVQGHVLAMIVSLLVLIGFMAFGVAAVTFSRDVVRGAYPE